ncbi:MAG: TonB-dependent receptor plug domain-containing protein, partial [Bacteroidota bacterium]
VYVLPDLTVTATRLERSAFEASSRIEIIDGETMHRLGNRSVADALQQHTGIFLRRYGGGGLATASLRGTGASQVTVLLDGRRISDPQLGQLDLSLIPSSILSRIEVMNGAASPLYGSDGVGGVVHARTLPGRPVSEGRFRMGMGSFGAREGELLVSGAAGPFSLTFAADVEQSENDYAYFSRPLNRDVRLRGGDRSRNSLYGSATYRRANIDARLSALHVSAERGLPTSSQTAPYERQWDESVRSWLDVRFGTPTDYVKVGGVGQFSSLRYLNGLLALDQTGRTAVLGADLEMGRSLEGTWTAIAGMEVGVASAEHPRLANQARELRSAAYLQTMGKLGPLMLNGATRADIYSGGTGEDAVRYLTVNPRLGVSLPLAESLRLRTSAGRGFRAPTFNDRFWMPGGNPDLKPEHGWTVDAGGVFRRGGLQADVTAFSVATRNQIVWIPRSGEIWSPVNFSRTLSRGIEAGALYRLMVGSNIARMQMRYDMVDARDRSDPASSSYERPLRYVPRHSLMLSAGVFRGAFEADMSVSYVGRRYITADATSWLDPYTTATLQLATVRETRAGRLRGAVIFDNLFDVDYAVVANRPMPPRNVRISLTLETRSN